MDPAMMSKTLVTFSTSILHKLIKHTDNPVAVFFNHN